MRKTKKYINMFIFLCFYLHNKKECVLLQHFNKKGAIAQLVEQRTENPCVPSSILGGTTFQKTQLAYF